MMEFLPRSRARGPPVVLTDDSLTLTFNVPNTMRMHQPVSLVHERNEVIDDDKDEDSWEDKIDFELTLNESAAVEDEEWEEEIESFPDEFPILIVNLSKLSIEHMGQELKTNDDATMVSNAIQDLFATPKFSYVLEVLFEQETAYHTTYGAYKVRLEQLLSQDKDVWAAIDYPAMVDDDVPLSDILSVLHRSTQWRSVNYIKDSMSQCSRDITWKAQVLFELEKLAESEHEERAAYLQSIKAEIDELSAARDIYTTKLSSLDGLYDTKSVLARRFAVSRQEEVESKLSELLDIFLDPTKQTTETLAANPLTSFQLHEMNVVDMVISMIFSRLPKQHGTTMEAHFKSLVDSHHHIRKLWVDDFGRLPPKTRVPDEYDEDEEFGQTGEREMHEHEVDAIQAETPTIESPLTAVEQTESVTYATEELPRKERRKKLAKAKKKKGTPSEKFTPFACVGGLSLLQLSQDEAAYLDD